MLRRGSLLATTPTREPCMFPRQAQARRLDLSIPSNIYTPCTISHLSPSRYRALRPAIDGLLTSNAHLNRWILRASWTPPHPPIFVIGSAGETGDLGCTPPCHTPAIPCIQHDAYSVSVHVRVGADPA
ncbi:hypothetical protein COCMIDRAFT_32096 [Bipolaris oryzae ATCC 44560]|uniref:Uncharacterized protein n=1 Tax=Bipolaris oryzae ATCC 44560 TaxID=930090 RepID=W6ZKG1_COCMI|nr:uncharacterized protein COCMIDRAFT_32096 [Bipolaris oryzae ATCC 44560]EUC50575.1 hypothetical protein COCMIDRAFT_32096 [Bipolaris oryzae ATCC 44560]